MFFSLGLLFYLCFHKVLAPLQYWSYYIQPLVLPSILLLHMTYKLLPCSHNKLTLVVYHFCLFLYLHYTSLQLFYLEASSSQILFRNTPVLTPLAGKVYISSPAILLMNSVSSQKYLFRLS